MPQFQFTNQNSWKQFWLLKLLLQNLRPRQTTGIFNTFVRFYCYNQICLSQNSRHFYIRGSNYLLYVSLNFIGIRSFRVFSKLCLTLFVLDGPEIHRGKFCGTHSQFDQKQCYPWCSVLQHHTGSGRRGHDARVGAGGRRFGCFCHQQHQPHVGIPPTKKRWSRDSTNVFTLCLFVSQFWLDGFFSENRNHPEQPAGWFLRESWSDVSG